MSFFEVSSRSREDKMNIRKENRLTLACLFICWMIVSVAGIIFYWTDNGMNNNSVDASLFFAVMFNVPDVEYLH